ncbi:hypothetical protein CAPTEDRAFT_159536 [Capitella teleta]|uniref:Activating signal cointegrator 1 complex subunit 3 n=1 Tax=Capitella teleta TaxID=283909 RepID=R7T9C7_CAPTE|nr:hypothetical protein CAPTEDRAFT_159536 [Capitella teleta]|eukprot:ELT88015.1 hypothetical protein CAPTEDRAFT_159536 [Capitella teleta]
MALPRLTGALRAFADVSASDSEHFEPDASAKLRKKRQQQAMRQSEEGLSWQQLVKVIKKQRGTEEKVTRSLRDLTQSAHDIVGEEASSDVIESGSAFLFEVFCGSEHVSHHHTTKLRGMFGPFPANAATKACRAVNRIAEWIPDDVLHELLTQNSKTSVDDSTEFGKNLKFHPWKPQSSEVYEWMDEESSDEEAGSLFDMKYVSQGGASASAGASKESEKVGGHWLRKKVELAFGGPETGIGMSITDVCSHIFDVLSSSKSDAELQNEFFELLGFDRFELIQEMLENRKKLIASAFDSAADYMLNQPSDKGAHIRDHSRPVIGTQVVVQSEDEKQFRKLARREEKKMGKKRDEEESQLKTLGFDPQRMKAQREAALYAAATAPMFSQGMGRSTAAPPKYPYVFDAYAEAKQSSSFIGGSKMNLPVGFDRENNKDYEEVNIPPSDPPPVQIGRRLIPISELDEIGQVAFSGMKSLNRIQSVVFETAYKTNENLLICAPTGAGKTNIAMLTVVHELKQHLSQGVIKKDEFKIIYVAPMKALAAEMVRNFGKRLEPLGIAVRELTGDMQLTKKEIMNTQMIVTTPEKWDVVTRKSTGDVALTQLVRLLIIDEVHLLHDDRGAVIESLVARTLRQVESSQSMIRILGLSATLPNYIDVATFLNVNPYTGLFSFDGRFRPVPLAQTFIGIKSINRMQQVQDFNRVCYDKVVAHVENGYQVMVFVHARNETVRTANVLSDIAKNSGDSSLFSPEQTPRYGDALKQISKSRNKPLRELFPDGFACHHAGMLRQDRNLVERFFSEGHIKCLVCTATLAWGVNLPAHAVIIKGTQLYDAKKGTFVDLGILDVMQIFGRAGRPQFDKFGHGTILTTHEKLSHYLTLLTQQNPIESQFNVSLTDNLNAEVSLGTVTSVAEAVRWLSYTYLYVRMRINPLVYGIPYQSLQDDPTLEAHRSDLIIGAARMLDKARMIRFDERTQTLNPTDVGRTASHYYIKYDTVEVVNEMFGQVMSEDKVFEMVSKSQEFEQIKVREEEMGELEMHLSEHCEVPVAGGPENSHGKTSILLQTYISRGNLENFSLVSDSAYVAQNAARIIRALFEMAVRKGWPIMAGRLLQLSKVVEKRQWGFESPLKQFPMLSFEILKKIEDRRLTVDRLREMEAQEIGHIIHHVRMGSRVKQCVEQIPQVSLEASIQPITRTVLRVRLSIVPEFQWNDKVHGLGTEPFWIWVEDPDNNHIYHSEYFMMHKKHVQHKETQYLVFTIPIFEPLPSQYYVRATSDRWMGSENVVPISFQHLILPEKHPPHTELLDLQPLPVTALNDGRLEVLYNFTHFNPIQTQIFHTLYHSDCNVLLGAPTGSGKTVAAEMAIFRVFREQPKSKCVYIAPLKALVRERMEDWKVRIEQKLGKKVVELTGDVTPDMKAVANADLIVTTPEKWDGISRSWQTRSYVKAVTLICIDEIHLLGEGRGPVLEVIVSRTNFISSHTERKVRVVGLSTALANARDLADWLGIKQMGLFNFRPSVRPVPLEVHINGFPGKHYCPRMATMNKPTYQAIRTHSPAKPALVFVSSRRQTRLTALDLIAYLASEDNPKQWLHMADQQMEGIITSIRESNLKLTLAFGIGLHHAGLHERDRKTVEELFVNQKIQVLIATSTLAWGVNFPAHLVVVKGTEYFDGKTHRYVDFPITDVLQMMGRAGRPQFDDQGKAVILVHDVKKHFYKKFLYEPFPVESSLLEVLADHLNAEIVAGTIASKQDAMDYLTWTYFFRRLVMNPSYYHLEDTDHTNVNCFLSSLVERAIQELVSSYCVEVNPEDNQGIRATTLGRISSYYYLHHSTLQMFNDELMQDSTVPDLLKILSDAHEYAELPVRHNEDQLNAELAPKLPIAVNQYTMDSAHTKTLLLLQAHFSQQQLPSSDYFTDLKSVLDQAIRVCQALLDVCADQGWLAVCLRVINIVQMVIQAHWVDSDERLILPHLQPSHLHSLRYPGERGRPGGPIETLPELMQMATDREQALGRMLEASSLSRDQVEQILAALHQLPQIEMSLRVQGVWEEGSGQQESRQVPQDGRRGDWIPVHADQEYVLNIGLKRINKIRRKDSRAYTPRFPKPKDEGWFALLGEVESGDLIALKRVSYVRNSSSAQLAFFTPETTGRVIYTLYLMSDSYLGLDQQLDVYFEVIPASIKAQINSELADDLDGMNFDE